MKLLTTAGDRLLSPALEILSSFCNDDVAFAKRFGELGGMKQLSDLLANSSMSMMKENLCWAIARFANGCSENQNAAREVGILAQLCDLVESGGSFLLAAIWALYSLIYQSNFTILDFGWPRSLISNFLD
jgi:hypothetical protein